MRWFLAVIPEREWFLRRRTLVWGFIFVHVLFALGLLPHFINGTVEGDLPLYRQWAVQGMQLGQWPGLDFAWVYPIGALVPIAFSNILGPHLYQLVWFLLIAALNAASIVVLTNRGRNKAGYLASWWWLGILVILSPVALLRLEGITAPIVIMALVIIGRRPIVASVLLAIATWIKVWPAAIFLAIIGALPKRRIVIVTGAVVTFGVALAVWALGGLKYITSFVEMQSDRGLQLEAPVTTPWLWLAVLHHPGSSIYNNIPLATREVIGPYDTIAVSLMTPLMALVSVVVLGLIVWAKHRGARVDRLFLVGALGLATTMVVFNKVGSPQYMLWLAPIIAVGLVQSWSYWRTPAIMMLVISVLTTTIFPIIYMPLVEGDPIAAAVLTLRNGLLVVLLGWTIRELVKLGLPSRMPVVEESIPARSDETEARRFDDASTGSMPVAR